MGWLRDLTEWFAEQIAAVWEAFTGFLGDWILFSIEKALSFAAFVIQYIPVPDVVQGVTLAGLLGNAGPQVAWCVSTFKIAEGLSVVGGAYVFRLTRKLLTVGQW